jgi:hypothetical protein
MRVSLKNVIVPSIPLAVLIIGFTVLVWLAGYFAVSLVPSNSGGTNLSENIQSIFLSNKVLSNIICLILSFLNAFLISQLNNRFTIIRTRTFLPVFIFLLLISTWNQTHLTISSHFALTLFILALFNFFNISRDKNASEQAFMASLLISASSLLINQFIFLIPVCWIGLIFFQSLSLRTFLASVFGTIAPWLIFLAISYFINPTINFVDFFPFNTNYQIDLPVFKINELVYAATMTLISIISIFGMYSISNRDATSTRNKLNFLVFLLVSLIIFSVIFQHQFRSFLPIIALVYALLFSHPLTLKQSNFYGILFTIFCVLNIAFVISKYILI